ncbi:MAG: transporter [Chloroherpetonaceae bacterium]|nr:transporter [Chloroherpetonaceae bacterium]MDW8436962.1 transporter [Chloroherpetonaceae bacterium]
MKNLLFLFSFWIFLSLHALAQSSLRLAQPAQRVRPFITDDARVVGRRLWQLESWYRQDEGGLEQWFLFAYGPTRWLELTFGGVTGAERLPTTNEFGLGIPLLQAKFLFKEYLPNELPGVGFVIGSFLPSGTGPLKPEGYGAFSYLAVTQSLGKNDDLLLHLNLGVSYIDAPRPDKRQFTWGLGAQLRMIDGFHFVGEFFSGDPYVPGSGLSYQIGFRHFFSDDFQIDGTFGKGIGGESPLPPWFSAGVRLVFHTFE